MTQPVILTLIWSNSAHLGRVERVVEVEDPGLDMGKAVVRHGAGVGRGASRRQVWTGRAPPPSVARPSSRTCPPMATKTAPDPHKDAYALIPRRESTRAPIAPVTASWNPNWPSGSGVSRTPIREALQRLETQSLLTRDGRSLIVASSTMPRWPSSMPSGRSWRGLAAKLAAQHAAAEEVQGAARDGSGRFMICWADPQALGPREPALSSPDPPGQPHNRFLVQQLRSRLPLDGVDGAHLARRAGAGGKRRLPTHAEIVEAIAAP